MIYQDSCKLGAKRSSAQDLIAKGYVGIPHGEAMGFYKAMLFEDTLRHPAEYRSTRKRQALIVDIGEEGQQAHHDHSFMCGVKRARRDSAEYDDPVASADMEDDDNDDRGDSSDDNGSDGQPGASALGSHSQEQPQIEVNADQIVDPASDGAAHVAELQLVNVVPEEIVHAATAQTEQADTGDQGTDNQARLEDDGPRSRPVAHEQHPSALNHKWGQYTFSIKKTPKRGGHAAYAWECRCPYHMKNDKTGCKKTATIPSLVTFLPATGLVRQCVGWMGYLCGKEREKKKAQTWSITWVKTGGCQKALVFPQPFPWVK